MTIKNYRSRAESLTAKVSRGESVLHGGKITTLVRTGLCPAEQILSMSSMVQVKLGSDGDHVTMLTVILSMRLLH